MMTLPQLEGLWNFYRDVPNAYMIGTANFIRINSSDLHYIEEGIMNSKQGSHRIYREYLYRYSKDQISLYFFETPIRLFHHLKFSNDYLFAQGTHLCKCDLYEAFYHFKNPNQFSLRYEIRGPKKDFSIQTHFTKINR